MRYRIEYQSINKGNETTEVHTLREVRSFFAKHLYAVGEQDKWIIENLEAGCSFEFCFPNKCDKLIVTRLY